MESDDITHLLHKVINLQMNCNWTRSPPLDLQCSEIWIQSHVDKGEEEEERRERNELPFFFFQLIYNLEDIGLIWAKRFPSSKNELSWFIKTTARLLLNFQSVFLALKKVTTVFMLRNSIKGMGIKIWKHIQLCNILIFF